MDAWTLLFTALCGLVVLLLVVPSVVRKLIRYLQLIMTAFHAYAVFL